MKIIVFGIGKTLTDCLSYFNMSDVVCFVDNSIKRRYSKLNGRLVLPPDRIHDYEYDFVVIFNQANTREIFNQLIDLGVPRSKIISWQYYIYFHIFTPSAMTLNCYNSLKDVVEKLHIKTILDINSSCAKNCIGVGDRNLTGVNFIDVYKPINKLGYQLYRNSFKTIEDIGLYDACTLLDYFLTHSVYECENLLEQLKNKCRYFIVAVPYPYPDVFTEWADYDFSKFGKLKLINCGTVRLAVIDTKLAEKYDNIQLYIVTHKFFTPPKGNMYVPIWAGKCNGNEMHIAGDAVGDSISELNPLINECTSLYWVWKNTHSDFVGFCHYRRYFSNGFSENELTPVNLLDDEYIHNTFLEYDMIVSKPVFFNPETVKNQLEQTLCPKSFDKGFNLVRNTIAQKYPDYLQDFDEFFDGHFFYSCNMFITSWEIFDSYCSWLFDIIVPAAKAIDVTAYDNYSKRVIGFMAERLLTLWILHNGIKVKEVPMLFLENKE